MQVSLIVCDRRNFVLKYKMSNIYTGTPYLYM